MSKEVEAFCGILGLDPLTMGNEGKFVVAVAKQDESRAFAALRAARYCKMCIRDSARHPPFP